MAIHKKAHSESGFLIFESRRYMAEILPIRRKTLYNKSNNHIGELRSLSLNVPVLALTANIQKKDLEKSLLQNCRQIPVLCWLVWFYLHLLWSHKLWTISTFVHLPTPWVWSATELFASDLSLSFSLSFRLQRWSLVFAGIWEPLAEKKSCN